MILQAILKNKDMIEVSVAKSYLYNGSRYFYLYEDGVFVKELHIENTSETKNHFRYLVNDLPMFKIGHEYEIQDDRNTFAPIDLSVLMKDFTLDNFYKFDGEMGAIYKPNHTIFRVFSPLATSINLLLYKNNNKEIYAMKKKDNGIFYYDAIGDYDGFEYMYLLKINGKYVESIDPYARSTSIHSKRGVVIDPNKFDIDFNDDKLKPLSSPCEAVIYETSVRDFTSSINTSIKNKGKYLGLVEPNRFSRGNNVVGIDYLSYLGISHVQLLPVTDFLTTNDQFVENTYNWGYDSGNMFALENSYASKPTDPYSRIRDFKKLVSSLHERNIRVVMDVVFNHQFTVENSSFEKVLPCYYFRYNDDGSLSNGSFCGNDFESRRYMARKFIVDTCLMYVKEFHVDGFRFDLMGLTDIATMNEVYEKCSAIRKDFILYGEGWDMPTALPQEDKAKQYNAFKTPSIGYFNDRYRDMVKGKSSDNELYVKGYLLGDLYYVDAFKHCFLGSCLPIAMPPLFNSPTQSINYLECHDNATLFDKLLISNYYESEADRLKRINLMNVVNVLSIGVAFIHAGQEIGLSKKGVYNSYNSGDEFNSFDTEVLDARFKMASIMKDAIALKKEFKFFNYSSKDDISLKIRIDNVNGRSIITYLECEKYKEVKMIINPSNESFNFDLGDYYRVIFNEYGRITGDYYVQNLSLNGISLIILVKE